METTTKNTTSHQRNSSERSDRSAKSAEVDPRETWQEASTALSTLYEHASTELRTRVQERPYAALAAAAGIGFVLGGGLRSITGRLLLRTTAQFVLPAVLASLQGNDA